MESEIITLNCPKCGSSDQAIGHELQFGIEFKCKHCGSTSVVIRNHRLYQPLPGEKICSSCGRVTDKEARFCQCGKKLVRICSLCLKEFPSNHSICDYCGHSQTNENQSLAIDRHELTRLFFRINDPRGKFKFALEYIDHPDNSVRQQVMILLNNAIVLSSNKSDLLFFLDLLNKTDSKQCKDSVSELIMRANSRIKKL